MKKHTVVPVIFLVCLFLITPAFAATLSERAINGQFDTVKLTYEQYVAEGGMGTPPWPAGWVEIEPDVGTYWAFDWWDDPSLSDPSDLHATIAMYHGGHGNGLMRVVDASGGQYISVMTGYGGGDSLSVYLDNQLIGYVVGSQTTTQFDISDRIWTESSVLKIITTGDQDIGGTSFVRCVSLMAYDIPDAAFTFTPGAGPIPLEVSFTDESTGEPDSWYWDFDDGEVSTLQNPVHTYTNPGTYTIQMTAINDGGSDNATGTVTALPSFSITPFAGPGGSIDPSEVQLVPLGESRTFTFIPDSLFEIDEVYIDGVKLLIPPPAYTFTNVQEPHQVNVTFKQIIFTITPSAGPGGSVSPSTPQLVPKGESVSFTFHADPAFAIDEVFVDGESEPWTEPGVTFTDVQESHTVDVTFDQHVPSLTGTTVSNDWDSYFNTNSPTLTGLLALVQIIVNTGAPLAFVDAGMNAEVINDEHMHRVTADIKPEDPFSPDQNLVMSKESNGWYHTHYTSGNPPKAILDFILGNGILADKLKMDILPYDPSPYNSPYDVTWESVTASDSAYAGIGNEYPFTVNSRLPTFATALANNIQYQQNFFPSSSSNTIMAAAWVAPIGSERIYVLITDPAGRRVGTVVSGEENYTVNEIPDAVFPPTMVYNDSCTVGLVVIPDPLEGNYSTTVYGNEPADFTIQVVRLENETLVEKMTVNDSIGQGETKDFFAQTIKADFTAAPVSGQMPFSVQFNDTSLGSPTHWNWSFGDGNTSTVRNPKNTYIRPGNYSVSLTTGDDRENDSKTVPDLIAVTLPLFPGYSNPPTDPDNDNLYEDLNGNGRADFADVTLFFDQMDWIEENELVMYFDFNGNGRIDFDDVVRLFYEI